MPSWYEKGQIYCYNAVHGFWPVEDIAEFSDGPTGCGEIVRVGVYLLCDKNNCTYADGEKD
jgi:hypothetical protein